MQHTPKTKSALNGQVSPTGDMKGLKIERRFTKPGADPLDAVQYEKRSSAITNTNGSVVFRMENIEVPKSWSQLATDIVVSKYFRKAGVPGTGHETSVRQVVHRIAHTIRGAGEDFGGYFPFDEDADAFEAELAHLPGDPERRFQFARVVQLRSGGGVRYPHR
ncbi:MAG: hypothetical protein IPK72_22505 [Candidatus Eisenbacteria bacterium]|nr:hypothetical protein [Candidatus Eisenbacteria bacterium]